MQSCEKSRPADGSARTLARATRAALLIGTALGCSISVFAASPALALNECGPLTRNANPTADTVTCTSAGNNYTSGITYDQQASTPNPAPPNDLTVVLQGGASPVVVNAAGAGVVVSNMTGYAATVVSSSGVQVTAGAGGVYAVASGAGRATVENYGSITAVGAGARAYNTGGTGSAYVINSGTVNVTAAGGGYAIGLSAGYTGGNAGVENVGAVTVSGTRAVGIGTDAVGGSTVINGVGGTVNVTGVDSAIGINAGAAAPTMSALTSVTNYADITAVATGPAGSAIGIAANGIGSTTVVSTSGNISATGASAFGVKAYAQTGNVQVGIGSGTTGAYGTSSGAGIYARAAGGSAVVYANNTVATGTAVYGLAVSAHDAATVTTGAVTTSGKDGIAVASYSFSGANTVTVSGQIQTGGDYAQGVDATSRTGDVTINLNGSVGTAGKSATGVTAYSYAGKVTVSGAGSIAVTGADSEAVHATSAQGNVYVTLNGAISASGASTAHGKYAAAVYASSRRGSVSVTGSGSVSASGAYMAGVAAFGAAGASVNLSGPVTATGLDGAGVLAAASSGSTDVTVGSVTSGSVGVLALNYGGPVSVTVNGAVNASGPYGVMAAAPYSSANASATVTVSGGASVTSAGGVLAIGYQSATIVNQGTITGSSKYAAHAASQGAATLDNAASGVINGPVYISGGASSTFDNAGVWNATGTSDIGAASVAGVMNNSGTVNVAPGASAATTVTVDHLGTWNNSGAVDMRNGHTGDVLALGAAAFNGYSGSRLMVDAALSGHVAADEVTAGAVSGSTLVTVADVTPTQSAAIDFTGATIFQGTSGVQSNFALGGAGYIHKGFVNYSIYFDPGAVTWNLVGLPGHAVFELLKLPQAGQNFAERSDDVWFWRTQEIRDSEAQGARRDGWEFWGQIYGGEQNLDQTQGFTFSPFHFAEDLSTRNSWAGVQFGVDHVAPWRNGRLLYGFTAGYLEQWTDFRGGAAVSWGSGVNAGGFSEPPVANDQFHLHGANVGAYLGYAQGRWFLNGEGKVDFATADLRLNSVALQAGTNSTTWTLNGEAGYRFGGQALFFEPLVKMIAGDTNIDPWTGNGATLRYPDNANLQTSLGGRVGGSAGSGPVVVSPYFGAYWVNEALADNRASFTTGGTGVSLHDTPLRGFARFDAGVTAKTVYGLEGFAKVVADTGSGVSGFSGDLGVRWRW